MRTAVENKGFETCILLSLAENGGATEMERTAIIAGVLFSHLRMTARRGVAGERHAETEVNELRVPMFKYTRPVIMLIAALSASVLLAGCEDAPQTQQSLTTVTYMKIEARPVTLTSELPGRTSAFMISEVRPQVSGIIQQRLFVEGSDVRQGEVLYQIDPALYQAAYDSAKATLMKAEANEVAAKLLAERYEKVVRVNAVSKQEYDNAVAAHGQAEAEVAAARASLESARINLEYTRVTAPVSGRIGRSTVTPGALVTQNQATPLATVQQLDPMYVDVTQSSTDLLRLKRAFGRGELISSGEGAMLASLKLEDGTTYTRPAQKKDPITGLVLKHPDGSPQTEPAPVLGTLKFSEVTVEQSTGVVTIRAVFPNPEGTLLPGMYVRAILEEGVNEKAILIPQKSVIRNNRGLPVVQVLAKDEAAGQPDVFKMEARVITIDRSIGTQWLVTDGLKEGEFILLEGIMRARAGMSVKGVLESAPSNGNTAPAGNTGAPAVTQPVTQPGGQGGESGGDKPASGAKAPTLWQKPAANALTEAPLADDSATLGLYWHADETAPSRPAGAPAPRAVPDPTVAAAALPGTSVQ